MAPEGEIEDTTVETVVADTSDDFDTKTALAEISSDLFGREPDETEGEKSEVVPGEQTLSQEVPPVQTENSEEVQATGAPTTWSKEALETWATVPDRAKQEILKREEDMFRGLEQYKEKAELGSQYDTVVEPYRAALAAENINPVELFQNFAGNHYLLSRGTPEQKIQIATNLIAHYGIDPASLISAIVDPPQVNPEIEALRKELHEVRSGLNSQTEAQRQAQYAELQAKVSTFASDPKNPYFPEVADDISKLLNAGVATTLEQAYEMAVWNNPATRAKEVARSTADAMTQRQTEEAERVRKANAAKAGNVKASTKTRDGTVPVGSIDDTLEETLAAINARG